MDFGSIKLTTERLKLRRLSSVDTESLFTIYSNNQVMKYWSSPPFTAVWQANELISNSIKWWEAGESICLAVEELTSSKVIGTVSLFNFHQESKRAEIGYILGYPYWGRGFMIEALTKVIEFSFSDLFLNRLEADIDPENTASAKLLTRLRFSLEGRLRQRWIVNGNISDSEIYGLLCDDWKDG